MCEKSAVIVCCKSNWTVTQLFVKLMLSIQINRRQMHFRLFAWVSVSPTDRITFHLSEIIAEAVSSSSSSSFSRPFGQRVGIRVRENNDD